jgi:hypothetical protein
VQGRAVRHQARQGLQDDHDLRQSVTKTCSEVSAMWNFWSGC